MNKKDKLNDAANHSINNMKKLKNAELAGCYHCKSVFKASEIDETTDEGDTALCPKCGIDAVLPDSSPYKLNAKTLAELKKFWF